MSTFHDKTGLRFGRLVVLERNGSRLRNALYLCRCDCGATKVVEVCNLTSGLTRSCGCLSRELSAARMIARRTTHGQSRTRTYRAWHSMIQRCCNPNCKSYPRYGGRGIVVDDPNWFSYQRFFDEMGEQPPGCDLHRIENDKGYSKGNCVWLAHSEHMRLHRLQSVSAQKRRAA